MEMVTMLPLLLLMTSAYRWNRGITVVLCIAMKCPAFFFSPLPHPFPNQNPCMSMDISYDIIFIGWLSKE